MGLKEEIAGAVEQGILRRYWQTDDLVALNAQDKFPTKWKEVTLKTTPPNESCAPDGTVCGIVCKKRHKTNPDAGHDKSGYLRFDNGDRGLWFCLRQHYRPETDPDTYKCKLPQEGIEPPPPPPPPPNAFQEAIAQWKESRYSDALRTLHALGLELINHPLEEQERVDWGNILTLVGKTFIDKGNHHDAYEAFKHAIRWLSEHSECRPSLYAEPKLTGDLLLEFSKVYHAIIQNHATDEEECDIAIFDPILHAYRSLSDPRRWLYMALLSCLLEDEDLRQEALEGMIADNRPEEELQAARSGHFDIVDGIIEVAPGADGLLIFSVQDDHSVEPFEDGDLLFEEHYQALFPSAGYEIVKPLGAGNFGEVFLAFDLRNQRKVAIKFLTGLRESTLDTRIVAFEQEAKRLSLFGRLGGVIKLYDFGVDPERGPFMVMEYMAGGTLRDHLGNPDVSLEQRLTWIKQLARGLVSLHTHPLLHRDLKPENILLSRDLAEVKIGDLGIATVVAFMEPKQYDSAMFGTPVYMSPEQFPPMNERSQRSEIYSLGLIFFEILTGKHPYWQPGMPFDETVLDRMLRGIDPGNLLKLLGPRHQHIAAVVSKCLAPDPGERYATAKELHEAIAGPIAEDFESWIVNKKLVNSIDLGAKPIPLAIKDRLVWKYFASRGELESHEATEAFKEFVTTLFPVVPGEIAFLKARLNQQPVKLVDRIQAYSDTKKAQTLARIPRLDLPNAHIDFSLIEQYPALVDEGVWAEVEVELVPEGRVFLPRINTLEPIEPMVTLEDIACFRKRFSTEDWLDFLVTSFGYNPEKYTEKQKLWLLTRLLPLVQNSVNLIELGPKGNGKTFAYTNISRHSVVQPGKITYSQLFFNQKTQQNGLLASFDCVVFDEVQTFTLMEPLAIAGQLKVYLEECFFQVGSLTKESTCGFVMLGNIPIEQGKPKHEELMRPDFFFSAPTGNVFCETAFLDRFNGILPGWEIPRMTVDSKAKGDGLQVGVLAQMLHCLKVNADHRDQIKNNLVDIYSPIPGKDPDMREAKRVIRSASGYINLLFPHLQFTADEFEHYCLKPAIELRQAIRNELHLKEPKQFIREMPRFEIRSTMEARI